MSDNNPDLPVSLDIVRQLAAFAEQQGLDIPGLSRIAGMERIAPTVNVGLPPRTFSVELGRIAAKKNLFLRGTDLLTVEENGDQRTMKPARFVTWIAEFVSLVEGGPKQQRECGMDQKTATVVLESDVFRGFIRKLSAVHSVRLPVLRETGTFELLPVGYDAESCIYTVETLKYETDWTFEKAKEHIVSQLANYPWSEGADIEAGRSAAVQVAAIIGTYCRAFFAPGTPRPMIAYLANQPGTGKSTLVTMALAPVFGTAPTNKTPKNDEIMDKELETVAQTLKPFVFFDDIGGAIFSNPLNRFITSTAHSGRIMGGNTEMFTAPAVTQVFATGNGIQISPDLMRRALIVDLFLATDVRGRKFEHVISASSLCKTAARQQMLSACYALLKMWEASEYYRHPSPVESFEEWTGTIAGIVQSAGFADPLTMPDLPMGGDTEGTEFRDLFCRMAAEEEADTYFNRQELVEQARDWGLLEELVGSKGGKELDSKQNIRLGRRMEKWRGRELVDAKGRRFEFGHRRQKNGATYPLHFLLATDATAPVAATAPAPVNAIEEPPDDAWTDAADA